MFRRKSKLKQQYDYQLHTLMNETREEWEQAKTIEGHLFEYNHELAIQRKIAECKHFYLYKEARARNLGKN